MKRVRATLGVFFVCCQAVLPAAVSSYENGESQTPRDDLQAADTAVVRGRIVAADTGAPLSRAIVRVVRPGAASPMVVATDERGRYEFKNVPAGSHTVSASKNGFLTLSLGQRRFGGPGRTLAIRPGELLDGIDISLPRAGVIVATVTDERGEPLGGVDVQAQQYRFSSGERRLERISGAGSASTSLTDDRGQVRLSGLPPGTYYLMAAGRRVSNPFDWARQTLSLVPTFFPGTWSIQNAQPVSVDTTREVHVSFSMAEARLARISGTIRNAAGNTTPRPNVSLVPRLETGMTGDGRFSGIRAEADGSFEFTNVLPGEYMVVAIFSPLAAGAEGAREYGRVHVQVGGDDVTGLAITTRRGGTLRGRMVSDTGTPPTNVEPGALQLLPSFTPPLDGLPGASKWNSDWTFSISSIVETALFRLSDPSGRWFLKAILVDGKDITDVPIDFSNDGTIANAQVVVTENPPVVSGTVSDDRNVSVVDYVAVVFAQDRTRWTPLSRFIAAGHPDPEGRFRIPGLPPGRYLAAAVDSLETGAEHDSDLLERLSKAAVPLTIEEGETKSPPLRLIRY